MRVRVPASDLPSIPSVSPGRTEHGASDRGALGELIAELAELKASVAELGETHARADRASAAVAEARRSGGVAPPRLSLRPPSGGQRSRSRRRNAVTSSSSRAELARRRRPWWQAAEGSGSLTTFAAPRVEAQPGAGPDSSSSSTRLFSYAHPTALGLAKQRRLLSVPEAPCGDLRLVPHRPRSCGSCSPIPEPGG